MADNLSVNVTADATQLRAQLALAQADLRSYSAAVRSAANDIKSTGSATAEQTVALERASAGYNAARSAVTQYRTALGEIAPAAESAAHGTAGITRELIVMGHEAMQGRFSRIPGSMMVLAERAGGVTSAIGAMSGAMIGVGAVVIGLAGAMAILGIRAHEAAVAMREAGAAAVLQGQSGPAAMAATQSYGEALKQTGIIGHAAAYQIASAIQQLPDITEEQKARLNAIAPGMFLAFGQDAEKTVKQINEIFSSDTSLKTYMDKQHLLSTEQMQAWADSTKAVDKYGIAIDALTARLAKPAQQFIDQTAAAREYQTIVGLQGETFGLGPEPPAPAPAPATLGEFEPGTQAPNPQQAHDTETAIQYSEELRKQKELTEALASAQRALAAAQASNNTSGVATAQAAIQQIQTDLTNLKPPGSADWAAKIAEQAKEAGDKAVVAAHDAGQQRLAIMEAGTRAELAVYKAASQDMSRTDAERTAAKRQALDLEMSLVRQQATGEATAAKQAFAAKVAEYNQEIAAAKGNVDQIQALETQKLAYIRSARGQASADYQNALKEETAAVEAAVTQQVKAIEEAGKRNLASEEAVLKDELATHQVTKAQEAQQALQEAETERDSEIAQLNTLISSLQEGTAAYTAAIAARTKLVQDFGTKIQQLQAQQDAATTQSADKMTQAYLNAFDKIGSAATQAFTSYVTYSETWQKAEQSVARAVLTSFIDLTETILGRWLVLQAAKLSSSTTETAVETAQASSASTTGASVLLANWLGLESAKTAATTTGAATRSAADSGGGFLSEIGSMLAHWLGLETAKTAATTAQAGARTAVQTTSATTDLATTGATNVSEALSYAAVGGAAAGQSVAAIPYVGWAMAPGVAAETYGVLAGFAGMASLDTGTSYVPHDMLAQIHQGEMVVPRYDADMIRGGDSFGSTAVHSTYAPTFNGGGAGLEAQARRDFAAHTAQLASALRNGQISPFGRKPR